MVVSLKANKKRIIAFLLLVVVVVGACFFLRGGPAEEQKEIKGGTNEERIAYLQTFGWQVGAEPAETREVMIPKQFNDVYTAYNVMQKAQGFDLKPYAGESCTQYKYKIENYGGEQEVYATLLVCGELIIGGDVACAEVDGFMHGFAKDSARYGETGVKNDVSSASSMAPESSAVSSAPESSLPESSSSMPESSVVSGNTELQSAPEDAADSPESSVESTAGDPVPEDAFPTD